MSPEEKNYGMQALTMVFRVAIAIDLGHVLSVVTRHFYRPLFLPIHSCVSHD